LSICQLLLQQWNFRKFKNELCSKDHNGTGLCSAHNRSIHAIPKITGILLQNAFTPFVAQIFP
jgi:hypothetical protein